MGLVAGSLHAESHKQPSIVQLTAPESLDHVQLTDAVDFGEPVLDEWLRKRAPGNQASGASRTFVVADPSGRVTGCYAMATAAVMLNTAMTAVPRNMPALCQSWRWAALQSISKRRASRWRRLPCGGQPREAALGTTRRRTTP